MRWPDRGTTSDLVARLVRFVDAARPGWSTRIRGASDAEIAAVEARVGQAFRFPTAYRQTLAAFGHDDDGLLAKVQGTHGRHRALHAVARGCSGPDEPCDPERPPVLGSELGIWLQLDARLAEPTVLFEDSDELFAASWEHLVFQEAATFVQPERHSLWASASPEGLRRALGGRSPLAFLDGFAAEHGFESAWFGDAKHRFLVRDDAALWVSLIHGIALAGYGHAAPARALAVATNARITTG